MEQIFTFGFGHTHPDTGVALEGCYIAIQGVDAADCRRQMFEKFGRYWGLQYDSREAAGVVEYGLLEITE